MGDYVYAISSAGVSVTNLTTMNDVVTLELEQPVYETYRYYDDAVVSEESSSEGDNTE